MLNKPSLSNIELAMLARDMKEITSEIEAGLHKPSPSFRNVIKIEKDEILAKLLLKRSEI